MENYAAKGKRKFQFFQHLPISQGAETAAELLGSLTPQSFDLKLHFNMMASPPMPSPLPQIKTKTFEVCHMVK